MDALMGWLVQLNNGSHLGFALLTVAVMATVGLAVGLGIELIFKALGIGYDRIESGH
jgi:hypothetical protein